MLNHQTFSGLVKMSITLVLLVVLLPAYIIASPFNMTSRELPSPLAIHARDGDMVLAVLFSDTRCKNKLTELPESEYKAIKQGNCYPVSVDAHSVFLYSDGHFYWEGSCQTQASSHQVNGCNWWSSGHGIEGLSF